MAGKPSSRNPGASVCCSTAPASRETTSSYTIRRRLYKLFEPSTVQWCQCRCVLTSGTSWPAVMSWNRRTHLSVPARTCAVVAALYSDSVILTTTSLRRRSPVERCLYWVSSARRRHWVPLPAPGPPITQIHGRPDAITGPH